MKKYVLPILTSEAQLPFYVYSVGGMESQNPVRRLRGYPHYVWLHTIRGTGKLILDGVEHILTEQSGLLLYPQSSYAYFALEEPWETHWVAFSGHAVDSFLQYMEFRHSQVFEELNVQLLDRFINEIYVSALSNHPESGLISSGKLYSFLIEMCRSVNQEQSRLNSTTYNRLQPVLSHIENNLSDDISLDHLASIIHVSPQYLCRLFKQSLQMSPVVYLIRLRLQKAKELLLEQDDLPVAEIGVRVGFQAASYFCSVFKQHEGMTPLEFRKSYR
ncbi:AraC family transcriptional regulator [Paenibacillus sp. UNC451MF]|uniref:AraC family transcriptional regulator n=1 Tax=Paenibacillus sp. UNC451MF TaxID=1449063 RepID=UPI00048F0B7A|nr:AraC family transcriptional regulator [Paenibacillus sp. UNC451MF]